MVLTYNYLSLEKYFLTKFCSAICSPVPTYTWKKIDSEGNEKPIVDGEDNIVFVDGDSRILEIMSTKKSHAGKYICTATIGEKSDSVEGELTYQGTDNLVFKQILRVQFEFSGSEIHSSHYSRFLCLALLTTLPS